MVSKLKISHFRSEACYFIEISMISSDIFDHRPCITIAKAYSVIFLNSISRKTKPIIRQKTANPLVLDGSGEMPVGLQQNLIRLSRISSDPEKTTNPKTTNHRGVVFSFYPIYVRCNHVANPRLWIQTATPESGRDPAGILPNYVPIYY